MDSTTGLTLSTTTKNLDTNTKTPPQTHDGSPKRHRNHRPRPMPHQLITVLYKECLKNHAATVGGHALDGCGEFMPSVISTASDPTSLKCAACGCHRNFHRREADDPNPNNNSPQYRNSNNFFSLHNNYHHYPLCSSLTAPPSSQPSSSPSSTPSPSRNRSPSSPAPLPVSQLPPPNYYASAPQMLLALTSGFSAPSDEHHHLHNHHHHHHPDFNLTMVKASAETNNNNNSNSRKKRMRTKFSQEQKEKMSLFAEKAGWRMQKCDKRLVEDFCSEIGIGKRVFKVWMHNNKQVSRKGSDRHNHDQATANNDVNQSTNGRVDDDEDSRANNSNNNNNNQISINNNEGSRVNFHDFSNVMSSSPSS